MNWIILITAGLMEVVFTFCLGKTKTADGTELYWWWSGFFVALILSMVLMAKASQEPERERERDDITPELFCNHHIDGYGAVPVHVPQQPEGRLE